MTFSGLTFSAPGDYALQATSDIGGLVQSGLIHISDAQLTVTAPSSVTAGEILTLTQE